MKRLLQLGLLSLGLYSASATEVIAQPAVLVENFRNVNCKNCRTPDFEFEAWVEENTAKYKVDMIYYHNKITDPQDPFYLASQTDVDRRSDIFYALPNDPYMYIQGFDASFTIENWKTGVDIASKQAKLAEITVSDLKSTGVDSFSMKVNVQNASGKQVRLHAALVESGIVFDNPKLYGQPRSGTWDNIFRKMLPGRDGSAPFGTSSEQVLTFNLTGKDWDLSKMKAVVFVQDVQAVSGTSRPIYGHTVIDLAPLKGAVKPAALNGFSLTSLANPFVTSTPVKVRLGQYGHLRLEMFDMTGKKISTLADNSLPEGAYEFNVGGELVAGTYLVNAFVDGNYAGQVKLVKQ
jgi:hypothetical protein